VQQSARLTVEDRLEIAEVIARFAHYSDYGDWQALRTVFTDDVVTEPQGVPVVFRGVDAQIDHARHSAEQSGGKNRHYYYNLFIEVEEGEVIARYMFSNVNAGQEVFAAKAVTSGRMRDIVVKTAGGWKISRRVVEFDQTVFFDA
jgi:ketosteroid isomerase-like protein